MFQTTANDADFSKLLQIIILQSVSKTSWQFAEFPEYSTFKNVCQKCMFIIRTKIWC